MRVALINNTCVKHDGISNAVLAEYQFLSEKLGPNNVKFFGCELDYPDLNHTIVQDSVHILRDSFFSSADLIIYHFGIHSELFNTILVGNGKAKQLVYYHNVTPKQFVDDRHHEVIDRSLRQQYNLFFADHVYCASPFNRDCLINLAMPVDQLSVLDFPVDISARQIRSNSRSEILELIFIGRFVQSKGVRDLLLALRECQAAGRVNFSLKIIGNRFSDEKYIGELRNLLASDIELAKRVDIVGEVNDTIKWDLLSKADVFVLPTYHEGFCVPIVEALAAGCFVISYDNSNVPNVTGGLGTLITTGDVTALAKAVSALCDEWASSNREGREPVLRNQTQSWPVGDFYQAATDWVDQFSARNHRTKFLNLVERFLPGGEKMEYSKENYLPISADDAATLRKGRNVRDGYARGWGLQFGDLKEKVRKDKLFQEAIAIAEGRTIVTEDNKMNIFLILKFFLEKIPFGHIVEFGSYKGGSALFMAYVVDKLYPGMKVYALDTFAGMPKTNLEIDRHRAGDFKDVDLEEMRRFATSKKITNLEFVQGLFQDTAPTLLPKIGKVSLAHIDCDIYTAVAESYEMVKPFMVCGGYYVFDDAIVSSCLGATEAVESKLIREDGLHSEQIFPQFVFRAPFEEKL